MGFAKLKLIKRELELMYKDLIKILFLDQIDKEVAIQMEKKFNNLIMGVNDHIDEIEIKVAGSPRSQGLIMEEVKVPSPALEIQKKSARANSTDFRSQQKAP
jgi:hypothetical protein